MDAETIRTIARLAWRRAELRETHPEGDEMARLVPRECRKR